MQCEAGWGWLIGTFPGGRKNLAQSFSHCRGQVFFRAAILPLSLLHSVDAPPLTSGILQFKDLCRTTIPQSTWCTIIEVKRIHYVVKLPEIMARFGAILSAVRRKFAKKKKLSNTAPFYVFIQLIVYGVFFGEKETDRHKLSRLLLMDPLYKQTARHHLGWVSVFFGDFFPWLPTFLCLPGLCLPSMPK